MLLIKQMLIVAGLMHAIKILSIFQLMVVSKPSSENGDVYENYDAHIIGSCLALDRAFRN